MLVGRKQKSKSECLILKGHTWFHHSYFNIDRGGASQASTQSTTFVFGGRTSPVTYEYLSRLSSKWEVGESRIPDGFQDGCAITISQNEIWLIGGALSDDRIITTRILSFDTINHTFNTGLLSQGLDLFDARSGHCCAFIPDTNKIIITGGRGYWGLIPLDTSEVIDVKKKSVTFGPKMKNFRADHGIGVLNLDNEERVVILGGCKKLENSNDPCDPEVDLDTIEVYHHELKSWVLADFQLTKPRNYFGFAAIKRDDLI